MGVQLDPAPAGNVQWQTLINSQGVRYRQISARLDNRDRPWGYVQVGRSLNDLDQNLAALRWTLLLGCPIAMLLVAWSSWWLAGLAMQPVHQSYQRMQQFTADAAHEFRTPLAAIQATIESTMRLQRRANFASTTNEGVLAIIQRQTLRLSQLVKDLLLLSQIEEFKQVEQVSCCLNDLIADLVEELAPLAIQSGISLNMKINLQQPAYVLGNQEQLYRLVSNLIMNAIQATAEGGRVAVSLNRDDRHAMIQIQDTGVGIAPADQARIFDRFYRLEPDRSRRTGGSGLGLSIAQAIAQAHRGSIHVRSELGKGSTFTIRLPLM
ncbi:ATP-binding protein [Microcoleus sp. FACHB-1515]|nr:ATP-binding protein [Microcoleus sp. FACHB-1515]